MNKIRFVGFETAKSVPQVCVWIVDGGRCFEQKNTVSEIT
nr:hypothetical protein D1p2_00002 [Serratia entomophila]ULG15944.1 hypothetical protein 591p_00093 [Serratia proteamaculans]ULG12312.1 hypothetical protein M3p_00014 [Serratia entomophila]ULG12366.1 hypothetical protein M3p_00070 [Serratia entomophila]ULG18459.1 hypothetical protein Man4p_00142 [Serratia proteamaculans]